MATSLNEEDAGSAPACAAGCQVREKSGLSTVSENALSGGIAKLS